MKRITFVRGALALSGILLSVPTLAQGPNNPPPPGAQSAPGGGGRGQRGGGRGGFRGGNFSFGTVSAVDASANTITVTPRGGGSEQIIQVSPSASLVTQTPTTVGSLRVGEQVRVSGIPTTITASQIVVGTMPGGQGGPGGMPGRPGGGFGGQFGGPGGGAGTPGGGFRNQRGGPGGGPGNGGVPGGSTMSITASVLSLNPLTLMAPDNTSITLKMASTTKISRLSTTTLGSVKVGDQIVATGQTGTDGVFTATMVADNLDMGSMMGRGGMGGFGGGGFGGGQGGRMRGRGRQNGGQAPAGDNMAAPPQPNDGGNF